MSALLRTPGANPAVVVMDDDIDGMSLYSSFGFDMPRNEHRVSEALYRDMAHSLGGDVDTNGGVEVAHGIQSEVGFGDDEGQTIMNTNEARMRRWNDRDSTHLGWHM